MSKPIIYLAFANDRDNPLESLEKEEREIRDVLEPREKQNHFEVEWDSFATREVITNKLTDSDVSRDLIIFHYSGHADDKGFETAGEKTISAGMAELLGKCPRLKLVVLNGCSTRQQVDLLLEKGVPAVIATHAPIKDHKAKEFGRVFYKQLAGFESIREAFDKAIGAVKSMEGSEELVVHRGIKKRPEDQLDDSKLWGLFYGEEERALEVKLPESMAVETGDFEPNVELEKVLINAVEEYVETIKKLQKKEKNSPVPVDYSGQKRVEMIKSLPYPISEPLRNLLAESTEEDENVYRTPSRDRLILLINLHDNLLDIFSYVLLSAMWDALAGEQLKELLTEDKAMLRNFLNKPSFERKAADYFPLIRRAQALIQPENCLMTELIEQAELFGEGQELERASTAISDIKAKGDFQNADLSEIRFFCVEAEKQLAAMFRKLGFLARYKMISVKSIDVFKNRSLPQAAYIHNVLRLVVNSSEKDNQLIFYQGHYETKSVLLVVRKQLEEEEESGGESVTASLNLTPFIIDEHAFETSRATEARLYLLDHLAPDGGEQLYRYIIQYPEDQLLSPAERVKIAEKERKQSDFRFLSNQFETFSSSLIS